MGAPPDSYRHGQDKLGDDQALGLVLFVELVDHHFFHGLHRAPDVLVGHPLPDCVFIGGGASLGLLEHLTQTLSPGTRIVANGVTLETDALLAEAHARWGGHLMRVDLAEAAPLGPSRAWTASRPITQWSARL